MAAGHGSRGKRGRRHGFDGSATLQPRGKRIERVSAQLGGAGQVNWRVLVLVSSTMTISTMQVKSRHMFLESGQAFGVWRGMRWHWGSHPPSLGQNWARSVECSAWWIFPGFLAGRGKFHGFWCLS